MPPLTSLDRPDRWTRGLAFATALGLEFGLVGPFGSYLANPFTRLAYWTGLFWAGALILLPAAATAAQWGGRRGFPPFSAGLVGAAAGCVPLAMLAAAGCHLFWPVHASGMRPQEWYVSTLVVALPCVAGLGWLEGLLDAAGGMMGGMVAERSRAAVVAAPPAAAPIPERLLALADCLEMEDHHVRVHTARGSTLHLAAMRDVVEALGEARGLQVHRSWWVARDAVRGCEQDGRAVWLVLADGKRVPVARQRVARLRAEGWLGPAA